MITTGLVKTGLRNEEKISELISSGSAAIKTKNEFGVHVFSGSIAEDGIISGQLLKPKYNEEELLKSIDTTIIELLPPDQPLLEPTILQSAYDEAISVVEDLTTQIEELNKVVLDLSSKVNSLEIVSESLRIDLDAKELLLAVSQNQTQQATSKVESSVIDLQTAIQKATAESIQRVSLSARNTSLIQENQLLNEQLQSAQGQIINLNQTINNLNSQLNTNQTALIQANNANAKKKKIICNELYRQGYLPQHIWDADERYGEMMWDVDRKLVIGYNMWAKQVVEFMRKNPKYTKYIYVVLKPWTEHMAYTVGVLPKDNKIGKFIHSIGKRYSYFVYNRFINKRSNLLWQ